MIGKFLIALFSISIGILTSLSISSFTSFFPSGLTEEQIKSNILDLIPGEVELQEGKEEGFYEFRTNNSHGRFFIDDQSYFLIIHQDYDGKSTTIMTAN